MYYTVIKHCGLLRALEKFRKHSPAARVFYISLLFSNDHRVLSWCNTRLRLLYLLIVSQPHLTDMMATQTMSNEKLLAKRKAVTFEQDMYYSQVN